MIDGGTESLVWGGSELVLLADGTYNKYGLICDRGRKHIRNNFYTVENYGIDERAKQFAHNWWPE